MSDVQLLLKVLPTNIVNKIPDQDNLIEVVLDLGRFVELRYANGDVLDSNVTVTQSMLDNISKNVVCFGPDNRAGINGTLHRISRILDRKEQTVGFTCRVGKPFYGSVELIKDFLDEDKSILLVGPPSAGKTTLLRDAARYLSEKNKRVIIVDTSNEIAGEGAVPHPAVGRSRRMQVPNSKDQHKIMVEAVENHNPQIIVIDEIGVVEEARAARTIGQRGVQLLATAHGRKLEDIIDNPPLCDLLGGINIVTLSDNEARERSLANKTVKERKTEPVFDVIVEIRSFTEVAVFADARDAVDAHISNGKCEPEVRIMENGKIKKLSEGKVSLGLVPAADLTSLEQKFKKKGKYGR